MQQKRRILFLALGFLCLTAAAALQYRNFRDDLRAGQSAQAIVRDLKQSVFESAQVPSSARAEPSADDAHRLQSEFAGILSIPCIGLELPVYAEYSRDALSLAPCRQYGTAREGNLVIAGHNFQQHFAPLGRLHPGDTLTFTETDGTVYSYTVCAVATLSPGQTELVFGCAHSLVLYTCNYSGNARLCIFCDLSAPG